MCWAKGGGKECQGPKQKKKAELKKKKGKAKANVAKEVSSDEKDESPIAFMNFDYSVLSKEFSEAIVILDTGASSHMTPHKNMLRDYCVFSQPRKI
jgi:hypothetical protein